MYIGKQIKNLRVKRQLTLSELAKRSGIQLATLSRIEHMKMVGTVESHKKIAEALGVDITELYQNALSTNRTPADLSDHETTDLFTYNEKASYHILTHDILAKKMLPVLLKLEPNGRTTEEKNQRGCEKFIYVLEGKLIVVVAEARFSLSKNNTVYFQASKPHYFINESSTPVKAICVTTPVAL